MNGKQARELAFQLRERRAQTAFFTQGGETTTPPIGPLDAAGIAAASPEKRLKVGGLTYAYGAVALARQLWEADADPNKAPLDNQHFAAADVALRIAELKQRKVEMKAAAVYDAVKSDSAVYKELINGPKRVRKPKVVTVIKVTPEQNMELVLAQRDEQIEQLKQLTVKRDAAALVG